MCDPVGERIAPATYCMDEQVSTLGDTHRPHSYHVYKVIPLFKVKRMLPHCRAR